VACCQSSYYVGGTARFAFLSGYPSSVCETLVYVLFITRGRYYKRCWDIRLWKCRRVQVGQDTGQRWAFVKKALALQDKNRNACRKTWQLWNMYEEWGTRWRIWLRYCATSRKVVGLIPHGVIDLILPAALESTQVLTKMSTSNISCGIKADGA